MEHIIKTTKANEMIEVTETVKQDLQHSGVREGIITVFAPHTTVGITIHENAGSDVRLKANKMIEVTETVHQDLQLDGVKRGIYTAYAPHTAAAMASAMGASVKIIVKNGIMKLGTRQGIYLHEFEGPRIRRVCVDIIQG